MKSSIKWRLVFLYVMLVSIVMIICGTYIVVSFRGKEQEKLLKDLELGAEHYGNVLQAIDPSEFDGQDGFKEHVIDNIDSLEGRRSYGKNEVALYSVDEGVLWYPKSDDSIKKTDILKRFMNKEAELVKRGYEVTELINYRENDIKYGGYIRGIDYDGDGSYEALLHIGRTIKDIDDDVNSIITLMAIAVVLSIVVSVILGLLFANSLTSPIIALTSSAKELASGNFTGVKQMIDVKSDDEIGELTKTFNNMAMKLNKTLFQISSEKNKLETVFAHMADGILVFNVEGELIHANPAAYNMLGLQIADKPFEDIMGNKIEELEFKSLLELDSNSIQTYMLTIKESYINACFATYIDKSNDTIGVITVLQDITEQKKLEEMQKEFVANVSHELRTPITTIKSYTETLLGGAMEETEMATGFLNVINNESDRMTTLVQDLLELSRLDNKQIKFNMKEMDITELVMDCYDKYLILAEKKQQTMHFEKPKENYFIMGDPHRIEQVIKNIISNAVKYSPEEAEISMEVNAWEDLVEIAIKDTGMGIPDEDLPRIFERFYRVDKARSRAMGGTGLGLAIVKEIVEHHGGEIYVSSEYGKGSTFYINFPIKKVI